MLVWQRPCRVKPALTARKAQCTCAFPVGGSALEHDPLREFREVFFFSVLGLGWEMSLWQHLL